MLYYDQNYNNMSNRLLKKPLDAINYFKYFGNKMVRYKTFHKIKKQVNWHQSICCSFCCFKFQLLNTLPLH